MFKQLHALLATGNCSLVLTVAAAGENLKVNVIPKPINADAPAALAQPLQLEGSPAELDESFAGLIGSYTETRKTLAQALADSEAVMNAAKDDASKKSAAAVTKASAKPAPAAAAPAAPAPQAPAAPAAAEQAGKQEVELF